MTLYHEVAADMIDEVLTEGLKCASRGEKGDKSSIVATDRYLDERRPAWCQTHGVSRDRAIYAFIGTDNSIIDISNGATLALSDYPLVDSFLLRLSVNEAHCYVSDLDRYDALRTAIDNHETATLESLAEAYWSHVIALSEYAPGVINRPEVMIAQDIPPRDISVVRP